MTTPPRGIAPLSDDELDRLQEFFQRQQAVDAMNIEELDGFFAALVVGPELVMPREYLPVVLGRGGGEDDADAEEDAAFENLEEANAILSLLMRHWNTIVYAVEKDEVYLPLILEKEADDDSGLPEGHRWARGFMRGVGMRRESWAELIANEDEVGAILPIALLAGEVDEAFLDRPLDEERATELLNHVAAGLHRMQKFFAPVRLANARLRSGEDPGPEAPLRRSAAKVGRNEPCPCGSGKKFKQCCGRPDGATEH
jgi:uncharacterized protein